MKTSFLNALTILTLLAGLSTSALASEANASATAAEGTLLTEIPESVQKKLMLTPEEQERLEAESEKAAAEFDAAVKAAEQNSPG